MSLKKNILANYVSQGYVTLIGIVMVPFYVKSMGAEAYGLVGVFTMMQAWFQLLDVGLSPMLSREAARYNAGAISAHSFRKLLRSLEFIFIGIAVLGFLALMLNANEIATRWLNVERISKEEVTRAIMLMSAAIVLRWTGGLYRGVITGFEGFTWLSGFNTLVATARFLFVVPLLMFVSTAPTTFFGYQLLIAFVETATLIWKAYALFTADDKGENLPRQAGYVRSVIKFSLTIAFTNAVWVSVTQTDKLLLSKLLPLSQYAYFTLAVLVANAVNIIGAPLSSTLLPRMAKISAVNDEYSLYLLYRKATQMVTVIVVPVAIMLAVFSKQLLWAWTGDLAIATHAAPILTLYAIGNGILALAAFPYYLQYAKGSMRLHLLGSSIFVLFLIPTLFFLVKKFGAQGAGYAWLGLNAVYFLVWVPVVHKRFFKGMHFKWLVRDIGIPSALAFASASLFRLVPIDHFTRGWTWVALIFMGSIVLFAALTGATQVRKVVHERAFGRAHAR